MTAQLDSFIPFTVLLGQAAHQQAEQLSQHCNDLQQAEQVYLNGLSVYAVDYYLQCLGFETDPAASQSRNPITQALADVADLPINHYGRLECRRVLPDDRQMIVPPEVWADRIGYVAVLLNETLESATLLGFVEQVQTPEIPLQALRSLDELPHHLTQFKPATGLNVVQLSQWLEGVVTAGWDEIATILGEKQAELAFDFRGDFSQVKRGKLIEVSQTGPRIAAIVALLPSASSEDEMDIQVEVVPTGEQSALPSGLQLSVLDAEGETVMNAQTRDDNQRMRLEFSGAVGDRFSVQIVLDDFSLTENFQI